MFSIGFRGKGRIRTTEGIMPADLQSTPFNLSGTFPYHNGDGRIAAPAALTSRLPL